MNPAASCTAPTPALTAIDWAPTCNASPAVLLRRRCTYGSVVEFVSENVSQWGYSAQQWCAAGQRYDDLLHPQDLPQVQQQIGAAHAQGGAPVLLRYRLRTASSAWAWVQEHCRPSSDAHGQLSRADSVLLDISSRLQLERLQQLALLEQDALLQLGRPAAAQPQSVLEPLLRAYQSAWSDCCACSLSLLDADKQTLRLLAACGLQPELRAALDSRALDAELGCCGRAVRLGQTVCAPDLSADAHGLALLALAQQPGLAATCSTPVLDSSGQALGSLALFMRAPGALSAPEQELLAHAARFFGRWLEQQQALAAQRQQHEQQLQQMALFDPLTGLPNRQLLKERFRQVASMARRRSKPIALCYVDLDNFKNINDSLGHNAGDALLRQIAQRISTLVRGTDTLSRQGGDEFVLLLPDCDPEGARLVAEKLLEFGATSYQLEQQNLSVTMTVGIAMYPHDADDFDALARNADTALNHAKRAGRDCYAFFEAAMQERSQRVLRLVNDMRMALQRRQFCLVYQPQIELASGRLVGVEALLRWQHPELGVISPAEFIPLAEESGLIRSIGHWVMQDAVQQMLRWQHIDGVHLSVAVNISAEQFRAPNLVHLVQQLLHPHKESPLRLELELTESSTMQDPQGAIMVINQISALQVSIAIDDFGTGYSSLSHLKRFNAAKLKIDQSFVRDLVQDADDKAILRAIIGMAEQLGMNTIAEGIENEEQLEWLRAHGCKLGQGYYFSRPLTPEQLRLWASERGLWQANNLASPSSPVAPVQLS